MNSRVTNGRLVELFSGAGGFSRGAHSAGFEVSVAYDLDPILSSSYARNFPNSTLVKADVSKLTGNQVIAAANGPVDGIFGGPPCQGFSEIGLRDAADPRRALVAQFFRVAAEVNPRFFVMENVRGLATKGNRAVLSDAMSPVTEQYDILGPIVWDAADFGAATKRARVFVIGIRKDLEAPLTATAFENEKAPAATVRDALADLSSAMFEGDDQDGFDIWRRTADEVPNGYAAPLRCPSETFTGHRSTVHSETVRSRFADVAQGQADVVGRHARLAWSGQCPTLRAGTGADRGSFQSVRPIHPEEDRVITVREAARLQGFPDSHIFHPTIWHSFRMIGNSVSPLMSSAIFRTLARHLGLAVPN